MPENQDRETIEGFGEEWARFQQSNLSEAELAAYFVQYFSLFPWEEFPKDAVGFDLGCGSGRWAREVAPRVGKLHCIDASARALAVARKNLSDRANCEFHEASVDSMPLPDGSMDFGYSLGVLHHVPDTAAAIASCARKLKPGAPLLLYLYYRFDNRPVWFRALWRISDLGRSRISRLPHRARHLITDAIATGVYLPLAAAARLAERVGLDVSHFPLADYRHSSFYTMRTDALDRFGTRLEQRFTREEIAQMMSDAGLVNIQFRTGSPFWCSIGTRAG
ncbi:MAG: class I SAM-dependent methyltransferase [Myxococcales bacterium]|nr:class I SAM-dependent methyltransferase [Myxococcales bacterium]